MTTYILPASMKVQRSTEYNSIEVVAGPASPYVSPRHFHEELEIALKPGGDWDFLYRGKKHRVPPGTIVLTQPGEPHGASSPNGGEGEYFGLRIAPTFLQQMAAEIADHPQNRLFFPHPLIEDASLSTRLLKLHASLLKEGAPRLEQDALLQSTILSILGYSAERLSLSVPGREPGIAQRARDYLQEHYQENISLQQLAHASNCSPFHLHRIFCAEIGLPPHLYQNQLRVARAKQLLAQGHAPVEVALQTGFASQSHLGWHFKRIVGITPGQYLRANSR